MQSSEDSSPAVPPLAVAAGSPSQGVEQLWTGPAGALQVRLWLRPDSDRLAVVCHPHPLMGGSMDNKVVTTLARYFRDRSLRQSVLVFNYRGVGQSAGQYADGIGELADLQAVIATARQQLPHLQVVDLAGFSFGGGIAALGADALSQWFGALQLGDVVLAAPAVGHFDLQAVELPVQTLVLIGEADEVIDPDAMLHWAQLKHLEIHTLADTGHFFHGQLSVVTRILQESLGE